MNEIKVLIVDDQVLFAEMLRKVLEFDASEIRVVGVVFDGEAAVSAVDSTLPDIVLMDVRMPKLDGVNATRILRQRYPNLHIIVLTTFDDDAYVYEALNCGAEGYLLKDIPPSDLVASIRSVFSGGVIMSPAIARKLVPRGFRYSERVANSGVGHDTREMLKSLSRREREVLGLIREGLDNREIAERLFLGEQTVRNYVSSIYGKLGVERRSQAARIAQDIASE
jgi:DNA-binding NarL/FixJ family response regulator